MGCAIFYLAPPKTPDFIWRAAFIFFKFRSFDCSFKSRGKTCSHIYLQNKGRLWLPKRMNFRKSSKWPLAPSHFRKIILQIFWGHIDVCASNISSIYGELGNIIFFPRPPPLELFQKIIRFGSQSLPWSWSLPFSLDVFKIQICRVYSPLNLWFHSFSGWIKSPRWSSAHCSPCDLMVN